MQFSGEDDGSCYLSVEEREKSRYNIDTGKVQEKELLKVDLIKALKNDGVQEPCGNKEMLQEMCRNYNLL